MKYLVVPLLALAVGTAACAQGTALTQPSGQRDYPLCSRTITDECINPSQATPKERALARQAGRHHAMAQRTTPAKR